MNIFLVIKFEIIKYFSAKLQIINMFMLELNWTYEWIIAFLKEDYYNIYLILKTALLGT